MDEEEDEELYGRRTGKLGEAANLFLGRLHEAVIEEEVTDKSHSDSSLSSSQYEPEGGHRSTVKKSPFTKQAGLGRFFRVDLELRLWIYWIFL